MSIVVVTIPGPAKQKFVADLQTATGGAVALVVVQRRRAPTFAQRLDMWHKLSPLQRLSRLYYGMRLRLRPSLQTQLATFQATMAPSAPEADWAAPTFYTYDVNSDATYEKIAAVGPTVLAVWGSGLLAQRLVTLPEHALNLHFGISTAYRGAYANQRAVEKGDWGAIGTTIHYLNGKADSGAVVASERLSWLPTPHEAFSAMHDAALDRYVACVTALAAGQTLPTTIPDLTKSENIRLEDWTPKRRFKVAKKLRAWHRRKRPPMHA